jgi:hypothetical protein
VDVRSSRFSMPNRLKRILDASMTKTISVTVTASGKSPMPIVRPMADVAQRLEAVVMPLTLSFSAQMVPAPMKPMPATMPPATCAG